MLCFLHQCQLLGIAAAYGDLHAVRYLLKEALVVLPTEPNDDNAAVVAAYFGHYPVVRADGNELSKWHLPLLLNCKHGIFLFMYFSSHGGIFLKTQRRLDPSVHFPMIEFPPLLREKINK